MEDITKEGIKGLKGLKGINTKENEENSKYWDSLHTLVTKGTSSDISNYFTVPESTDVGMMATDYGYGESVYDEAVYDIGLLPELGDIRAEEQGWGTKISNGVAKAAVLTATTFADSIVGTLAGVANVIYNSIGGNTNSLKEGFNQFIDNPFSAFMQDINDYSESLLPNYYSRAEQEEPWYENIFTANFIGDKFLKNTGFMVGAALGAYVTGGAGAKVFVNKGIRDAFKGTVVNTAGKTLTSGKDIYKAYKTGDAFMDGVKLTEDLGNAAKQLKNAEARIKLLSAATSAMGEGRIEAINGAEEATKFETEQLESSHNDYINNLEQDIYDEHPEWFSLQTDSLGNTRMVLTSQEGLEEYLNRLDAELNNYEQAKARISLDKLAIGNTIFSLNVPLLMGSNLWQFGKILSGGYNTGRLSNVLAKGSIKEGFQVNKDLIRKLRLRALSSPLMEALEEMSQASILEGAGMWTASSLNNDFGSFYGGKIDPKAEEETDSWLNSISKGFVDTYTNLDRWEEGFIGGLTGFLGIPKVSMKTNKKGKRRLSIEGGGELWEGLKLANQTKENAEQLVAKLNERVQSKDFVNMYLGMVRHNNLQNAMNSSLERGSNFDFKNYEFKLLISDTMMFDKAGKLEDLYDYIEQCSNMTEEDASFLRQLASKTESGKSVFDGMTDLQIILHVKKQADLVKQTVDKYVEVSNNLKTLYGDNITEDTLDELTWGMTQVDNWESRINSLAEEVRKPLLEKALEIKEKFGVDVPVILNNLSDFTKAFSGDKDLINEIVLVINDNNLPIEEQRARIDSLIKFKEELRAKSGLSLGATLLSIKRRARERREALTLKMNSYESSREAELESRKALYKKELERLSEELNEFFINSDTYSNLKIHDLKLRALAMDAFELMLQDTNDIEAAYKAAENIMFREVYAPLSALEERREVRYVLKKDPKTGVVSYEKRYSKRKSAWEEHEEFNAREAQREYSESLFSLIVTLKEMLSQEENTLMSPLDTLNILSSLSDLINLHAVRSKFIDTYLQLSDNPALFTDAFLKLIKAAVNKLIENEVDKLQEPLSKITSLKELKEFFKDKPVEILNAAIERANKGEDKNLKKLFKNLSDIREAQKDILGQEGVDSLVADFGQTPEVISALNMLLFNIENAESVSDILKGIDEDILHLKETAGAENIINILNSVKERYSRAKESSRTNSKDSNKAKNIKKKKTKEESEESEVDSDSLSSNPFEFYDTKKQLRKYIESRELDITTKGKKFNLIVKEIIDKLKKDGLSIEDIEKDANKFFEELEGGEVLLAEEKPQEELPEEKELGEEPFEEELDLRDEDNEGEEDEEDIEDESKSKFELLSEALEDLDDDDLKSVIKDPEKAIKNKLIEIELSEDSKDKSIEILNIKSIALSIYDIRENAHYGSEFESGKPLETNSDNNSEADSNPPKFKSSALTEYEISPLKDRQIRRKKFYRDLKGATSKLRELGAFDFVNEGRLADLLDENPKLEIHYILPPVGSPLSGRILLGIKVNDDNEDTMINPIEAGDGNRYLIVGTLGYYKNNKVAQDNYGDIWDAIKKDITNLGDKNDINNYYVTRFSNRVERIYSGRMVKSSEENGVVIDEVETRNLGDIVDLDEELYFGIYYSSTDFRTPGLEDEEVVPLNFNNANPREGSVWLLTKEADGKYYAKAVGVKLFTREEYDLDENSDSPILLEIRENISDILDSETSEVEKLNAKLELKKLLYFPEKSGILFTVNDNGNTIVSVKDSKGNTIASFNNSEAELEELVDDVIEALQSYSMGLRFQVSTKGLEEKEYKDKLIASNILTTDISQVHNVNASFDMPLLNPETGDPLEELKGKVNKGHTGRKGINNTIDPITVILENKRYSIREEEGEKVYKFGRKIITDEDIISEIELQNEIDNLRVNPFENSNLYIGTYNDGEEFGIINGKVLRGKELKKEKSKHMENKKKEIHKKKVERTELSDWELDIEENGTLALSVDEFFESNENGNDENEDLEDEDNESSEEDLDWLNPNLKHETVSVREGLGLEEDEEDDVDIFEDEEEDSEEQETEEPQEDKWNEKAIKVILKLSNFNAINSNSVGMSSSSSNFLQYLAANLEKDESPILLIAKGLKMGIDIENIEENKYKAILNLIRCGK